MDVILFLSIVIFYLSFPMLLFLNRWFTLPSLIFMQTIVVVVFRFRLLIFIFQRFDHFQKLFFALPAILNDIIPFLFMPRLYPLLRLQPHLIFIKCSPPFRCVLLIVFLIWSPSFTLIAITIQSPLYFIFLIVSIPILCFLLIGFMYDAVHQFIQLYPLIKIIILM